MNTDTAPLVDTEVLMAGFGGQGTLLAGKYSPRRAWTWDGK